MISVDATLWDGTIAHHTMAWCNACHTMYGTNAMCVTLSYGNNSHHTMVLIHITL